MNRILETRVYFSNFQGMSLIAFICIWMISGTQVGISQVPNTNDIFIQNGSFEGTPKCCEPPNGWIDCGFKGETPPDVQPALDDKNQPFFSVTKTAFHGNTYLGMVVRENDTYERVSQRLIKPMLKGTCYSFSIMLCRSSTYLSASNKNEPGKGRSRSRRSRTPVPRWSSAWRFYRPDLREKISYSLKLCS